MKAFHNLAFVVALSLCAFASFQTERVCAKDGDQKISHVVLIGVDGAGAFFREADTPNLDRIFANGAVTYKAVTSKPTISAQSWGSMLHGVTPEFHRLTNSIVSAQPYPEDSLFPSVFRVIRENMPDAKLASFCHWTPINIGIIENNLDVLKEGGSDAEVTNKACAYLEQNEPTLLFVHFDEVDGAGHGEGYGGKRHLEQLHTTDGYIQKIYATLEKRGLLDSTLFIVSADHGGNGRGHGGWTDGEKYIMFAATGPGVVHGEVGEMGVRDISSVILYALGLADKQPDTWTSRVPSGVFKGVEAKERPVFEIKYAYEHRVHEPSPTPDPEKTAPAIIGKDRAVAYFPFDGNAEDALKKVDAKSSGKLYFVDGYFDNGARFDDGFVSIPNLKPGKSSWSVAFWMKTGGVEEDPAIISNKDWRNGTTKGFVLTLRQEDVKFNLGNGAKRMDAEFALPFDYRDGWVHVVFVVDREAGEIRLAYDFGKFFVKKIPDELKDADFDCFPTINIGQDGTGKYRAPLGAVLDELMIVEGTLKDDDVAALKALYK